MNAVCEECHCDRQSVWAVRRDRMALRLLLLFLCVLLSVGKSDLLGNVLKQLEGAKCVTIVTDNVVGNGLQSLR